MPDRVPIRSSSTLHGSLTVGWVLWLLALTAASLLPNEYKPYSRTDGIAHPLTHLAVFAVAGALSVFAFRRWFPTGAILVLALAVWLEWIQARKFGISIEIWDVVTNLLGTACGMAATWWRLRAARPETIPSQYSH